MSAASIDFALLGHPASYKHLGDLFAHSKPDFDTRKLEKYQDTLTKFFEWTPSYVSKTPIDIRLSDGRTLCGRLIICTFLPECLDSPRKLLSACKKTEQACALAKSLGVRIVGLGGFTSIVGGAQGADLAARFGIQVTSGNSLTAALAVAQVSEVLARIGWPLNRLTVAFIGASGDIGRACALALAPRARHVVLVARNRAKLDALRSDITGDDVHVSTKVEEALQSDLIIAATSASSPLLAEKDLLPGTIVCDIGYPKNLLYAAERRADVLAISGGLAQLPFELDMMYQTQLPQSNLMYGCFSEAILLALSGRYESFSSGQGQITLDRMNAIFELALCHGIRPAPLCRGSETLDDSALANFMKHAGAPGARRRRGW